MLIVYKYIVQNALGFFFHFPFIWIPTKKYTFLQELTPKEDDKLWQDVERQIGYYPQNELGYFPCSLNNLHDLDSNMIQIKTKIHSSCLRT